LPPLSSPKDDPPQGRSGCEATATCDIRPSGGGNPSPVTPKRVPDRACPRKASLGGGQRPAAHSLKRLPAGEPTGLLPSPGARDAAHLRDSRICCRRQLLRSWRAERFQRSVRPRSEAGPYGTREGRSRQHWSAPGGEPSKFRRGRRGRAGARLPHQAPPARHPVTLAVPEGPPGLGELGARLPQQQASGRLSSGDAAAAGAPEGTVGRPRCILPLELFFLLVYRPTEVSNGSGIPRASPRLLF